ncbi:MAG: hypothetical protein K9N46_02235 [Candidatus Marinimicrobia bacterium]|nr:hypothetical protein [Candidatus Neomarinimicrobiota bacterium]MCF7828283.1 hypothetical protein [Candidatus Neomarinimicrobiota bacterium]MCF7879542.1 hypothetical protein [Candidatus Neomarinimicrobiota bacterium]
MDRVKITDRKDILVIHVDAVLDIIGHEWDLSIQLFTNGKRIGIAPPEAAAPELVEKVYENKDDLMFHFNALAKLQRKYNERLQIEQDLERVLNEIGPDEWKNMKAFSEWENLTRELSRLIDRLESFLGRPVTPEEATDGFPVKNYQENHQ